MAFAENQGWLPPREDTEIYGFDDIPRLAEAFAEGRAPMFPIYRVNDES